EFRRVLFRSYGTQLLAHHRQRALPFAVEAFHLDHVGAEIGEQLGAVGPEHHLGEVQDADAVERAGWDSSHGIPLFDRNGWESGVSRSRGGSAASARSRVRTSTPAALRTGG